MVIAVYQLVEVFELIVDEVVELLAEFQELLVPLLMSPNIGFFKHELIAVTLLGNEWKIMLVVLLDAQVIFIFNKEIFLMLRNNQALSLINERATADLRPRFNYVRLHRRFAVQVYKNTLDIFSYLQLLPLQAKSGNLVFELLNQLCLLPDQGTLKQGFVFKQIELAKRGLCGMLQVVDYHVEENFVVPDLTL